MFDKFKQAKKLKDLQSSLSKEKETVENGGVRVIVNGQMKVEKVEIDENVEPERAGELVKDCVNKALKKMQKKAAQKMQEMGGI